MKDFVQLQRDHHKFTHQGKDDPRTDEQIETFLREINGHVFLKEGRGRHGEQGLCTHYLDVSALYSHCSEFFYFLHTPHGCSACAREKATREEQKCAGSVEPPHLLLSRRQLSWTRARTERKEGKERRRGKEEEKEE